MAAAASPLPPPPPPSFPDPPPEKKQEDGPCPPSEGEAKNASPSSSSLAAAAALAVAEAEAPLRWAPPRERRALRRLPRSKEMRPEQLEELIEAAFERVPALREELGREVRSLSSPEKEGGEREGREARRCLAACLRSAAFLAAGDCEEALRVRDFVFFFVLFPRPNEEGDEASNSSKLPRWGEKKRKKGRPSRRRPSTLFPAPPPRCRHFSLGLIARGLGREELGGAARVAALSEQQRGAGSGADESSEGGRRAAPAAGPGLARRRRRRGRPRRLCPSRSLALRAALARGAGILARGYEAASQVLPLLQVDDEEDQGKREKERERPL